MPASASPVPPAYEKVVLPHVDSLRRAALRLTHGRRDDAEDLVQDTLARAFDRFHTFRQVEDTAAGSQEKNARAWVHTILRRLFLSRLPKQRREAAFAPAQADGAEMDWVELVPDSSPDADPAPALMRRAAADALWESVRTLPDDYRVPLLLVSCEGMGYDEAAARLGIPAGTLRSRVFRARRLLRSRAGQWFDDLS